jgi:ADP-heptose:LPS heptosyltransferase
MNEVPYPPLRDVTKIAVLRPSAVGDFVLALPALHALRQCYREAEIVYLGKQWHADFLRGRPGPVDRVEVVPPCPGVGMPPDTSCETSAIEAFVARMRACGFDLAVQLYGGGEYSNPFTARLGARLSIGMKSPRAPPLDRWISFGPLQNRRLHLLEVASLAGACGLHLGPELEVAGADRREADHVLPAQASQPLVVIHPASSDPRRCWAPERFARLADVLAEQGALIAVNGTVSEAPLVRQVIEGMRHPALDLTARLSLGGLCGLLERAALLVSNDSGPLHLGLAIGTPCVGIYWLSNLIESGPLRQGRHRAALSLRTRCPLCGAENLTSRCAHDVSFVDDVSLEEVVGLALELFAEVQQEAEAASKARA